MTSSATRTIKSRLSAGRRPRSVFTVAAARLSTPNARIIGRVKRISPIAKFSSER